MVYLLLGGAGKSVSNQQILNFDWSICHLCVSLQNIKPLNIAIQRFNLVIYPCQSSDIENLIGLSARL